MATASCLAFRLSLRARLAHGTWHASRRSRRIVLGPHRERRERELRLLAQVHSAAMARLKVPRCLIFIDPKQQCPPQMLQAGNMRGQGSSLVPSEAWPRSSKSSSDPRGMIGIGMLRAHNLPTATQADDPSRAMASHRQGHDLARQHSRRLCRCERYALKKSTSLWRVCSRWA
jgi:hypothetical protein